MVSARSEKAGPNVRDVRVHSRRSPLKVYVKPPDEDPIGQRLDIGNNTDGRQFNTGNAVLTAGVYNYVRLQFDSSKTNEADTDGATEDAKVRLFTGTSSETARALSGANIGAGGTLSTGAASLADGLDTLVTGSSDLAVGTQTLADGSIVLASGASEVSDGAAALSDGNGQLAAGTAKLVAGTQGVAPGALMPWMLVFGALVLAALAAWAVHRVRHSRLAPASA